MRLLCSRASALVALALSGLAEAIQLTVTDVGSVKSAASTVAKEMMGYYHGEEPGQAVGNLPDPYYWWEAGAMFMTLIEYWAYTGDTTYNDIVIRGIIAQIGEDTGSAFMPKNQTKTEGNDDQAFWAFATLSAAELKFPDPPAKSPSWLALAQAVFNTQVARWDQTCGGGLRWQIFTFNAGYNLKNTISNGGFFQLAARLARYTGNQTYVDWADKMWDWVAQSPLMTADLKINDNTNTANGCSDADHIQWSYNYGTFLVGAAYMYNHTQNQKWRDRVYGILKTGEQFFPEKFGSSIMSEIACEPTQSCNNDQPSFKAYLSRWMALTSQLVPDTAGQILPKLKASAVGAAGQCIGGGGSTCGRHWYESTWDGKKGIGEQMSALSVIGSTLIGQTQVPVTGSTGGTSKGDPSAGQGADPVAGPTKSITTADRAGAWVLTVLVILALGGSIFAMLRGN
ncbi:MAG: hydrolase 76 protein [Vezdaea aestivalis]|nr:MAG: hydrolase 76 protein [Vezdaea aestivalis]